MTKRKRSSGRSTQEAAYARRSAVTIFRDALKLAEERNRKDRSIKSPLYFWHDEAARMRWVLEVLRDHPLGKVR